ncbi:hypothetical protein NDU88_006338 [Pleurodeles waltl]|uniref:Uncharacterized protein n=1 Tax=Pleurodeles waltl TaxID=8319 RepID=A0AAV7MBY1_PLEWA|nr:hypothetical protein NDU88_006338 [Pleurodeles waltl]
MSVMKAGFPLYLAPRPWTECYHRVADRAGIPDGSLGLGTGPVAGRAWNDSPMKPQTKHQHFRAACRRAISKALVESEP